MLALGARGGTDCETLLDAPLDHVCNALLQLLLWLLLLLLWPEPGELMSESRR